MVLPVVNGVVNQAREGSLPSHLLQPLLVRLAGIGPHIILVSSGLAVTCCWFRGAGGPGGSLEGGGALV